MNTAIVCSKPIGLFYIVFSIAHKQVHVSIHQHTQQFIELYKKCKIREKHVTHLG